jgi:hypothetical protein
MPQGLTAVGNYSSEIEARMAEGLLESAGIDCMVQKDDCGGMRPHLAWSKGVKLLVREEDADTARELLAAAPAEEES